MRKLLIFLVLLTASYCQAQDLHFSQFNAAPYALNPALTGVFNGRYRFVANHRNQWYTLGSPFQTYGFSAERSFQRDIGNERDIFGLGLNVLEDVAGTSAFNTLSINLPFAYAKDVSIDGDVIFSAGAQISYVQKSLNPDRLLFNSQYVESEFPNVDPNTLPSGENITRGKVSYLDFAGGVNLFISKWNKSNFNIGLSAFHVSQPQYTLLYGATSSVNTRFGVHTNSSFRVSKYVDMMPGLMFFLQGQQRMLLGGSYFRIRKTSHSAEAGAFYLGAFYRALDKDAIVLNVRFDYKKFNIGLSYDHNISDLHYAAKYLGAYEVSLIYTIPQKELKPRDKYACPMF